MIKNIIFDLGNVIVDFDPSRIVNSVFTKKEQQNKIYKEIFCSQGWKQLDRGVLTFEEHTQNLILQFPQYAREIKWILNNWHRDLPYIPGMFSVIKAMKTADYDLYVLSNASQRYLKYALSKKEIFKFFKGVTISAQLKLMKPEREIYEQFCQIHGLKPEACLFIDDKAENVQAAVDAGWQAYQFKNPIDLINYLESTLSIKLSKTDIPQKRT